jgi:hypothetical protein
MLLVFAVAGCSGPRSGISVTSGVDACAAALPVARAAVHNHGKLVRVHALRRGDLLMVTKQLGLPPPPSSPSPSGKAVLPPVTTKPTEPPTSASGSATAVLSGTSLPAEPEPRGCLVVFQAAGARYKVAAVDHPIGTPRGRYAIAVVKLHKARLIVVILTDTLPKPLAE